MTTSDGSELLVLETRLFPDADTVLQALAALPEGRVKREAVDAGSMTEAEWDRLLQRLLQADKVITL
jgi:hypothetical protein